MGNNVEWFFESEYEIILRKIIKIINISIFNPCWNKNYELICWEN